MLVLMIDDNMRFVERMKHLLSGLESVGYINVANDYDDAIRLVRNDYPDVILLDINLPGKNGMEILRDIRKNGVDCRVIMLTNHADEYYRNQCFALGADYFLDKSTEFGKVREIISSLHQA